MKFDFDNAFLTVLVTIAAIGAVILFVMLMVGLFISFGWYALIPISILVIAFIAGGLRFV